LFPPDFGSFTTADVISGAACGPVHRTPPVIVASVSVRVEKIDLPGVGTRHDIVTRTGRRIGVVTHRGGERELAVFDPADPDSTRDSIALTDDEAAALADVLGASLMLSQLAGIRDQAAGLFTEQILIPAGSPFAGGVLGDTKARTRTSSSIVAIIRGKDVIPSPTPGTPLEAGDTVVAVGTRDGLDALAILLSDG
jgi:TrkA domain protein